MDAIEEFRRNAPRKNLFLSSLLETGASPLPVRIRNLSVSGALIEGQQLVAEGAQVTLKRGRLSAAAEIVWFSGKRAGVRFSVPIELAEWLPTGSQLDQANLDQTIMEIRSGGGFRHEHSDALPPEDILSERLVQELEGVARALDLVAEELIAEPLVLLRHSGALQDLSAAGQTLTQVAKVVGSTDKRDAVQGIELSALKRRLLRIALPS